jgi:hypothetical protein
MPAGNKAISDRQLQRKSFKAVSLTADKDDRQRMVECLFQWISAGVRALQLAAEKSAARKQAANLKKWRPVSPR